MRAKYRHDLPQLTGRLFLTDGGLFNLKADEQVSLPEHSTFSWLRTPEGTLLLKDYYQQYLRAIRTYQVGFILESPTWRASSDWAETLNLSDNDLCLLNRKAINMLMNIRQAHECVGNQIPISGCIGPQHDNEIPSACLTHTEAKLYHMPQVKTLEASNVDFITAMAMTYSEEAIGIAQAALSCHIPCVIAFIVNKSGKLPSGETLKEAITRVDHMTHESPLYYMINCDDIQDVYTALALETHSTWIERIQGIRGLPEINGHATCPNYSTMSMDSNHPTHSIRPNETTYDDKARTTVTKTQHRSHELALEYNTLKSTLPSLNILGGCCGPSQHCIDNILTTCGILWEGHSNKQTPDVDMRWPFYGS